VACRRPVILNPALVLERGPWPDTFSLEDGGWVLLGWRMRQRHCCRCLTGVGFRWRLPAVKPAGRHQIDGNALAFLWVLCWRNPPTPAISPENLPVLGQTADHSRLPATVRVCPGRATFTSAFGIRGKHPRSRCSGDECTCGGHPGACGAASLRRLLPAPSRRPIKGRDVAAEIMSFLSICRRPASKALGMARKNPCPRVCPHHPDGVPPFPVMEPGLQPILKPASR